MCQLCRTTLSGCAAITWWSCTSRSCSTSWTRSSTSPIPKSRYCKHNIQPTEMRAQGEGEVYPCCDAHHLLACYGRRAGESSLQMFEHGTQRVGHFCIASHAASGSIGVTLALPADGGGVLAGVAAQPHPGDAEVCVLLRSLLVRCPAQRPASDNRQKRPLCIFTSQSALQQ